MSVVPLHPLNDRVHPSVTSPRGSFLATVKENHHLCTDHFRLILTLPRFPASEPGQFVQLDCRESHTAQPADDIRTFDWPPTDGLRICVTDPDFNSPLAYLRRPFSIADHRIAADGVSEIDIIHRVVGKGTTLLAKLQPGQQLSLLGPLGGGFHLPAAMHTACLVGGGVGIPPMMYLAKFLRQRGCPNAVGFIGAQRRDLLPVTFTPDAPASSPFGDPVMNVEEFAAQNYPAVITTDDGSLGMKGYVTQALRRFLEQSRTRDTLEDTIVFCCGPTPMMKATAKVAADFAVPCQVSLEQPMACGMGTCQSCVIRYRPHSASEGADWKYKLTCTDGPVFDTQDILW